MHNKWQSLGISSHWARTSFNASTLLVTAEVGLFVRWLAPAGLDDWLEIRLDFATLLTAGLRFAVSEVQPKTEVLNMRIGKLAKETRTLRSSRTMPVTGCDHNSSPTIDRPLVTNASQFHSDLLIRSLLHLVN